MRVYLSGTNLCHKRKNMDARGLSGWREEGKKVIQAAVQTRHSTEMKKLDSVVRQTNVWNWATEPEANYETCSIFGYVLL